MWRSQLRAAGSMASVWCPAPCNSAGVRLAPCNEIDQVLDSQPDHVPDFLFGTCSARLVPVSHISWVFRSGDSRVQWFQPVQLMSHQVFTGMVSMVPGRHSTCKWALRDNYCASYQELQHPLVTLRLVISKHSIQQYCLDI